MATSEVVPCDEITVERFKESGPGSWRGNGYVSRFKLAGEEFYVMLTCCFSRVQDKDKRHFRMERYWESRVVHMPSGAYSYDTTARSHLGAIKHARNDVLRMFEEAKRAKRSEARKHVCPRCGQRIPKR